MLVVKDLSKSFSSASGDVTALNKVNLTVQTGEFASIIGKSGSGKSTLLSMLGALDIPTSGSIEVDGVDIAKLSAGKQTAYRAKKIGFVFQHYNLIPNLTALENVMLALEFGGMPAKKRKARAEQLLTDVGLEPDEQLRKPPRLSGGRQQRVSIARALANHPAIVLADEPTGNLDSETGKKIFDLLHRLSRSEKTTILAVTHDMDIAGKTDRTFKLKDGKIIA
ncbi:MAG: ABC transporter ATP-binding protein [Candidatus Saccharibacteria bacterium]